MRDFTVLIFFKASLSIVSRQQLIRIGYSKFQSTVWPYRHFWKTHGSIWRKHTWHSPLHSLMVMLFETNWSSQFFGPAAGLDAL